MIIVEAKGLACPMPVIEAKKALRNAAGEDVLVRVDNEVAVGNLKRLAESMQLDCSVNTVSDELFEVTLSGQKSEQSSAVLPDKSSEYIVQITSSLMGQGNDELGAILMKSFVYSLTEMDSLPYAIVFYNAGVELTCEGSPVLEDLHSLMDAGVKIFSCGTCLDFLGLKEKLALGEISNMYGISELLRSYHAIRP